MPYQRYAIVGIIVLSVIAFAYARSERETGFELTPEELEVIRKGMDPATAQRPVPVAPRPSAPQFLDVTLDPSARPYDRHLGKGGSIERRPLAVLHAPSRRVLFMGGEWVAHVESGEYEPVTLAERRGRRYRVDAIWAHEEKPASDRIVGVVIVERDTPVVRWRDEGPGYGTDAGLGAITTVEWEARPKPYPNEISELYDEQLVENERMSVTADVDGRPGVDTIIFYNGFGDGGFPSVAGYDAAGRRAQIVLWTVVAPWRLAFPDGRPPSQVTAHENELAACLAGDRLIDGARCRLARR